MLRISITKAALGKSGSREIVAIIPGDCGDAVPSYDVATDKLFVRVMSTAAEVGNGVSLAASTFKLT